MSRRKSIKNNYTQDNSLNSPIKSPPMKFLNGAHLVADSGERKHNLEEVMYFAETAYKA